MTDQFDERLRALSHKERRRLLLLCRNQAKTAGELSEHSVMTAASVSEHLKVLRKTGLAQVEKRGKFWLYRANGPLIAEVLEALRQEVI